MCLGRLPNRYGKKYAVWYERVQGRGLKNEEALIRLQVRIRASQEPAYASTA
jgi:hypothetical protein